MSLSRLDPVPYSSVSEMGGGSKACPGKEVFSEGVVMVS